MLVEYNNNSELPEVVTYTSLLSCFTSLVILAIIYLFKQIKSLSSFNHEFTFITSMALGDFIASISHGPIMLILNATNEQEYASACTVQGAMQQFGESLSIYSRIALSIICNTQYYLTLKSCNLHPTFLKILILSVISATIPVLPFVGSGYGNTNFKWCWISGSVLGHIWRMSLIYIPIIIAFIIPIPKQLKSKSFRLYMRLIQYSILIYFPPLIIRIFEIETIFSAVIEPLFLIYMDICNICWMFAQHYDLFVAICTFLISSIGWINAVLFYFLCVKNINKGNVNIYISENVRPAITSESIECANVIDDDIPVEEYSCVFFSGSTSTEREVKRLLFDVKSALQYVLSDCIPAMLIDIIHSYLFIQNSAITMNVVTSILLKHFNKETVDLFADFCATQEYQRGDVHEDTEEYENSAIAEYMRENMTNWTNKQCVEFIKMLRDITGRIPDIVENEHSNQLFYESKFIQDMLSIDEEKINEIRSHIKFIRNKCNSFRTLQMKYQLELNINDLTTLILAKDILRDLEQSKVDECHCDMIYNYLNTLILKCYPMFVDILTNENGEYSTIYHEAYYRLIEQHNTKLSIFNDISLWIGSGKYQSLSSYRAIMEYKHFWSHFECGRVIGIPIDWDKNTFNEWILLPFTDKVTVKFNNFQMINISLKINE
eukprot:260300_1